MKKFLILLLATIIFAGCQSNVESEGVEMNQFTQNTKVVDVINYKNFDGFGRLIFPANINISNRATLKNLDDILIWYSDVKPARTVEIVNYMKEQSTPDRKFSTTFTLTKKKFLTRAKMTRDYFSFAASQMKSLQSVTLAAAFTTSAQCMTVSRTRWNFLNAATMPLR